ncbi:MAG: RIP metalloprotease RseP, partial [Lysobacteraceae bacterium]
HVLRFSIGFGKPLFKHIGKDGTEYVIAAIPLGGYVKMLDESEFEIESVDQHRALNRKPVLQRMAVAAAGPAANFLLCFALFWAMFLIGLPDYQPIVGEANGMASQAGFVAGDRLVSVDGEPVATWTDAAMQLSSAAMDRKPVQVEVAHADGGHAVRTLPLQKLAGGKDESAALNQIGLVPQQFLLPAIVGSIAADGPTAQLQVGDRILAVDGVQVSGFAQMAVQVHALARADAPLHLTVLRGSDRLQVDVHPKLRDSGNGKPSLTIGIGAQPRDAAYDSLRRYGPIDALGASAHEMRQQVGATLAMLGRIFFHGNTQGVSSVVGIARYANEAAHLGLAWFLYFLAILSISLGIINLLPVPILDGGHLLYYLIELVKGSPAGERSLVVGQYIGLALLGGLMCLAFYNDLLRPPS